MKPERKKERKKIHQDKKDGINEDSKNKNIKRGEGQYSYHEKIEKIKKGQNSFRDRPSLDRSKSSHDLPFNEIQEICTAERAQLEFFISLSQKRMRRK